MSLYNMREIDLYNDEIKRRFIEERLQENVFSERFLLLQFDYVAEYEREHNKDVCNFSLYEIMEYLKMRGFVSLESANVTASILNSYTTWCLQNSLVHDGQNHFEELSQDLLMNTLNKAVLDLRLIDRETFVKYVNEIVNPRDQFVLMMLFETGKSKDFEHIFSAQFKNFNAGTNELKLYDGRIVKVSNELAHIIDDSYDADIYYSISGNNAKKTTLITIDDRIMKSYPNQTSDVSVFQQGRVVYNSCVRSLRYLGLDFMNANAVVEAGKIAYITEQAKTKGVSGIKLLQDREFVNKLEYQFNFNLNKRMFIRKYNDYLA